MLLVSVFASDQPDTTESGCTAIAIVLHFTVILQYVWLLAVVRQHTHTHTHTVYQHLCMLNV